MYIYLSFKRANAFFSRIRSRVFQRVSPLTVFLFFELSRGRLHVPTHTKTPVLATLIFYVLIGTASKTIINDICFYRARIGRFRATAAALGGKPAFLDQSTLIPFLILTISNCSNSYISTFVLIPVHEIYLGTCLLYQSELT